jgi:hypothetical protein
VIDPDAQSWEARFGHAVYRAKLVIGIPRPIRLAPKWPFAILAIFISVVVVTPLRAFQECVSPNPLQHGVAPPRARAAGGVAEAPTSRRLIEPRLRQ